MAQARGTEDLNAGDFGEGDEGGNLFSKLKYDSQFGVGGKKGKSEHF